MAQTFKRFLVNAFDSGNYSTDDIIAFVRPLFEEVLTFHEGGLVAPFEKEESLFIFEERLDINEDLAHPPKQGLSKIVSLWAARDSKHFDIVGHVQVDTQVDEGSRTIKDLDLHLNTNEPLLHPAYIPGYNSYEILLGHHDAQTDIFCLGLVLGSIGLGLDLNDTDDLKTFVSYRLYPSRYNPKIHPTLSTLITEMTELDRNKRSQDLYDVIQRLVHYRDYDEEKQTDLSNVSGWVQKELTDKNQVILSKLRNRLFDTSRRNRLLYYKPNARFMNLTVSSVPMVLRYQSIRPELLFTWNPEISGKVKDMKDIILNKYLRFEDHQYIAPSLDKIRVESQRDVNEYGFSQLKLVTTFLNWHNLKEDPQERIQSPLLLIPVELKRNKKLKEDHYVLKILDNEAEVNPVLANYLRELYGIRLPDFVDLDETSLEDFYQVIRQQIDGTNQGITLQYVDKPRIKLIHSVAKQTINNYRKRLKRSGNTLDSYRNIQYSYQPEHYKPLGLEIFRQRVEPRASVLEFLVNEDIKIATHELTGSAASKERTLFELMESESNPYRWDFDLCNLVVGNFNYKKMSLVRDYNHVVDQKVSHAVFENLFSNEPRQQDHGTYDLNSLENWNHVIAADPTQTKAVLQSRFGKSYIIQGPPGTGKSQTITNLIADFVARGKSVLFVCEKRAALDVVFHRLKQQGLDELCCYIHDSQSDKREFIRNLKATYEDFTTNRMNLKAIREQRETLLRKVDEHIQIIRTFHDTHKSSHPLAGTNLRTLLDRVLSLQQHRKDINSNDHELIPAYQDWVSYGKQVESLLVALSESGFDESFSEHPASQLNERLFIDDSALTAIEKNLTQIQSLLTDIQQVIEKHELQHQQEVAVTTLESLTREAKLLHPLSSTDKLFLLDSEHSSTREFSLLLTTYDEAIEKYHGLQKQNINWQERFSAADTKQALELAKSAEPSFFSFFNGSWRKLKKQLKQCYDFSKHHVRPSCVVVLQNLADEYEAQNQTLAKESQIRKQFGFADLSSARTSVLDLQKRKHEPTLTLLLNKRNPSQVIDELIALEPKLTRLSELLETTIHDGKNAGLGIVADQVDSLLANTDGLSDIIHDLRAFSTMSESLKRALRKLALTSQEFESAIAHKTLNAIYRENKKFSSIDYNTIERATQTIRIAYKELLRLNAELIRATIRHKFLSNLELANMALSQLNTEQRQFKKDYNEGRKILENEFSKSMRYKSIRELSGKESGMVLKDLKPVWLMSPLSVSDSLPINTQYFDTIIYDEASQITLEEGVPALFRAPQAIIVGDDKQMPPTNFFTAKAEDPDDLESIVDDTDDEILSNDADSLLVQGVRKLSGVMLGWHYRSRYETLISYSNHAFYSARLLTIPDKTIHHTAKPAIEVLHPESASENIAAIFDRSISYHHLPNALYEKRINTDEATYIAHLVKKLLTEKVKESIGIVAFSQEQQNTIEDALESLASKDKVFEQLLEEAYQRTEEDQFVGLFVKNLENVQGDERDIIIMSVCYGFDSRKKMLMNFGPINKKGGEKRLNVIFSRARKHMAIVSSIKHTNITNEYNEGANYFKRFLHYAELISNGNTDTARLVLDSLVLNKQDQSPKPQAGNVLQQIKQALIAEGYEVTEHVGHSDFKCSLAVKAKKSDEEYALAILIDDDLHYQNDNLLEQYFQRPSTLEAFGWRVIPVFAKDWLSKPDKVMKQILKRIHHDTEILVSEEDVVTPSESVVTQEAIEPVVKSTPNTTETAVPAQYEHLSFQRLTFTDQSSNKFWEAATDENKLVVRFGRIGTKGQIQIKTFSKPEEAMREKDKLIREKTSKGYK